jgi:1-acyl-sn-glycerol-3-phosphate acyltransferase
MDWGANKRRYASPVNRMPRAVVQSVLLKPVVNGLLNVHVHGLSHLDMIGNNEAFVLIANHSSHFDAPLVFDSLPRRLAQRLSTGAAADYFFKHWYMAGPTQLFFNAFPVDRTGTRNRKGLSGQLLGDGVPIFIFPEGTRSRTGGMGPFHPGAAALCISHQVPALPVALVGAHAAWPAGQARWTGGHPDVHVVFGSPMMPIPGEIATAFSKRLRAKVIELHDGTAIAYGMPTQDDMLTLAAIEAAA